MKRGRISFGRALIFLALCTLFILQRIYQQPFLSSLGGIHDTLRIGNNFFNIHSVVSSRSCSAIASSTATINFPALAPTGRPDGLHYPTPPQDDRSSTSFSYLDCSTKPGNPDLFEKTGEYVRNIMKQENESTSLLKCPALNATRYSVLTGYKTITSKPRYFLALDLYQSTHIIERLLGSVVEVIRFLGPENCVLSIVEGRSTDGTYETLKILKQEMKLLGVRYHLHCIELDPKDAGSDRILTLALLRNHALQPLTEHPEQYDPSTRIVFLNDVALCAEDILELVHQGIMLNADMTCAVDWYGANFYDVWIGRSMIGDLFFEIPQSQSWEFADNLFWNHEESLRLYSEGHPLQVFSCWNGAVAMIGKPFLEKKIEFRSNFKDECRLGEPIHLCKDLWKLGHGKIAVVPSVNVGYNLEDTARAKERHGTVSGWVEKQNGEENKIRWSKSPPPQIKCMIDWSHPSWVPWNQGLRYVEKSEIDIPPP